MCFGLNYILLMQNSWAGSARRTDHWMYFRLSAGCYDFSIKSQGSEYNMWMSEHYNQMWWLNISNPPALTLLLEQPLLFFSSTHSAVCQVWWTNCFMKTLVTAWMTESLKPQLRSHKSKQASCKWRETSPNPRPKVRPTSPKSRTKSQGNTNTSRVNANHVKTTK